MDPDQTTVVSPSPLPYTKFKKQNKGTSSMIIYPSAADQAGSASNDNAEW